jgi:hypothetical protein
MPITLSELQVIANKWFDAFNNHNLEQLLSLYDENARHYSPKLKIRQPETKGLIDKKASEYAPLLCRFEPTHGQYFLILLFFYRANR